MERSTPSQQELSQMRLREITELSEDNAEALIERFTYEVESTNWNEADKAFVYRALADAQTIHQGDTQGNRPFIVHPLRVATRILSHDHFNVRDRPDLIIAALLHDTVEDHPERWIAELRDEPSFKQSEFPQAAIYDLQQRALNAIAERYRGSYLGTDEDLGDRIRTVVQWLTSMPYRDDLTSDTDDPAEKQLRKWDAYEDGVRTLMRADDALGAKVIKLSDNVENFIGGMKHHEKLESRAYMARKYIFLADVMINYVEASKIIPTESKRRIIMQYRGAKRYGIDTIQAHVKLHPADVKLLRFDKYAIERLKGRKKVKRHRLGLTAMMVFMTR